MWLDAGELTKIRGEYSSETDRTRAAETLFDDMFGSQLDEAKRKSREHRSRMERFAILTRWIGPGRF